MRKIAFILSLFALVSAWSINQLNLNLLTHDHPETIRLQETVQTADDASYLAPAQNFLKTGELKNNVYDKSAYFLRPPGYSLWLILHGGGSSPLQLAALKFSQLLLFSIGVYCLFFISLNVLNSKRLAIAITCIYGVSTIASGFLYYTITEAITPALILILVFTLMQANKQVKNKPKQLLYIFAAGVFAFIFITRPVLGVFALALVAFIVVDFWKDKKRLLIVLPTVLFIAFAPMGYWQLRNSKIAGEYVGLHPIYFNQHSASCFRPTHKALWELCKGWGETGANFHAYFGAFWNAGINGDTSLEQRQNLMNHFPKHVVTLLGKEQIDDMLKSYQKSIDNQRSYYASKTPMPAEIPAVELETIQKIETLVSTYQHAYWFEYYVKSPLRVFKSLAFHSNLSLYVYQKSFRGHFLMEAFRLLAFFIHSAIFILLLGSPFLDNKLNHKAVFSYTLLIYIFYLIFVQRGIEERYTLPIFALVLVSATQVLQRLYFRFRRK